MFNKNFIVMKKYWILITASVLLLIGLGIHFLTGDVTSAGQFALDYFAIGNFAAGIFAVGNFSLGIFSIGIFSIGIFSLSIFNIGIYTIGFFVLGWQKNLPNLVS
jgi:hypothetical protein